MKNKDFIEQLQKLDPEADVFISDQQGGGGEVNSPYATRYDDEFHSGDIAPKGSIMISFENT